MTSASPEMLEVWGKLFSNPALSPFIKPDTCAKAFMASFDEYEWVKSNEEVTIQKKETTHGTKWVVYNQSNGTSHRYESFLEAAIEMARILDPDTYNDLNL